MGDPAGQRDSRRSLTARLRDFAELARLSNLPTTFTNVLVGAAAGAAAVASVSPESSLATSNAPSIDWLRTLATWTAIACFYTAGMALNDVVDARLDSHQRPNRPIPSGRVSHLAASLFTAALIAIGLAILAALSMRGLIAGTILVAGIVAYNLLHHFGWSAILMGLCRGMVYCVAAATVTPPTSRLPSDTSPLIALASSLTLYTILFTFISRSETEAKLDRRELLAPLLVVSLLTPLIFLQAENLWLMGIALAAMLGWLARSMMQLWADPPRTRTAVMGFIAAICLIDAFFLALMNQPLASLIAVACFVITHLGHRYIAGT